MNKAIAMAMALKNKSMAKSDGGVCKSCGGKIGMSHGGMVDENEMENMQPSGGYMEDEEDESEDVSQNFSEGGGVDGEYDPHSISDSDGDSDDLTYSPEVPADDFKDDNEEDEVQDKFLKAYAISRRLRG